jgi:hypothetical protein
MVAGGMLDFVLGVSVAVFGARDGSNVGVKLRCCASKSALIFN